MSLENEIRAAIRDGLTGLTLWRVGASAVMWQASTRWHGHDAFCVAIEADPIEAQRKALAQRPTARRSAPKPATAPAAPKPAAPPSLDEWDDEAPAAPEPAPASDDFEW